MKMEVKNIHGVMRNDENEDGGKENRGMCHNVWNMYKVLFVFTQKCNDEQYMINHTLH